MDVNEQIEYRKPVPNKWQSRLRQHQLFQSGIREGEARCLDVSGLDLREIDLGNSLKTATFRRCLFAGRTSWPQDLEGCEFRECDLSETVFEGVNLHGVVFIGGKPQGKFTDLTKATFCKANLYKAVFNFALLDETRFDAQCTFEEPGKDRPSETFSNCRGRRTNFAGAKLSRSVIDNCRFHECYFHGADFRGATLKAHLRECNFSGADFQDAGLSDSTLHQCNFGGVLWKQASIKRVEVDGSVFSWGRHLFGRYGAHIARVQGAERARYSFRGDKCSWAVVRFFGSIRLFSASYIAIIAIWLYARAVGWYNDQLGSLRLNGDLAAEVPLILRLRPLPVPSDLGFLLIAIILLAVAATLYHFGCPSIVKEHTETQWKNVLGREVFEYRIHCWRRLPVRWISGICYVVGGMWVLIHLGVKVCFTLLFLFSPAS